MDAGPEAKTRLLQSLLSAKKMDAMNSHVAKDENQSHSCFLRSTARTEELCCSSHKEFDPTSESHLMKQLQRLRSICA